MSTEVDAPLPPVLGEQVAEASAGNVLTRALELIPRALASKPHIMWLIALGLYLIVLPVLHIYTPGAQQMLIGGNYTNVTSDLGACIAAGGTLRVLHHVKQRHKTEQTRLELARQTHAMMSDIHKLHLPHLYHGDEEE